MSESEQKTISVATFAANCLALMAAVATGRSAVIRIERVQGQFSHQP